MMTNIKFKIENKLRQVLMLTIIIVQSSCQSNKIYIDFDRQLICSSNSKGIWRLHIENDSDFYQITWTGPTKNAPLQLSISPLTKGYTVASSWMDTIVNPTNLKLRKNQIYLIKREQGDAGAFSVKVLTNEKGNFLKIVQ